MSRSTFDFNNGFCFALGDHKNAEATHFDDSLWQRVALPHDWSIYGEFKKDAEMGAAGGYRPSGIGWYRKSFNIPAEYKGKVIELEFGAIHRKPTVYINGKKVAFWVNGYITKLIDISEFLNYGGENIIAVRVDNADQPASRYYTGCGIYRDVKLIVRDVVCIKNKRPFVTTPLVSQDGATVQIKTTVENKGGSKAEFAVKHTILDTSGEIVVESVAKGQTLNVATTTETSAELTIANPNLWSVEQPYLYTLVTEVIVNGDVTDRDVTKFGVRTIYFDKDKGFFLNGKHIYLKGVCLHHDNSALGAVENVAADRRRLKLMQDMGVNAIRLSHNPFAESFLDLCDEMGLLVMDEFFDEWKVPKQVVYTITETSVYERKESRIYHEYFDECWEEDMVTAIIRDRNHPSIIMYSIGNEIHEQRHCLPDVEKTSAMLYKKVKEYDTTRPVTCACCFENGDKTIPICDTLDIVGYNYADVRFNEHHKRFPDRLMIGSETVTISPFLKRSVYDLEILSEMNRYVERTMGECFDQRAERICSGETSMRNHMGCEHVSGVFIWTGIDYLGEPTPHTWPSRSAYFGAADTCCFPKDPFYYYKSIWGSQPVIHLMPHWNLDVEIGTPVDVIAYTNCKTAELFINGKSVGTSTYVKDRFDHFHWKLPYEKGELKVLGYDDTGNVIATDTVVTAGAPCRLVLSADRSTLINDCRDTAFITAKLVDDKGNIVPTDEREIEFFVDDGLELMGVDNGDQEYTGDLKSNKIPTLGGLALAIVSAKDKLGEFKITATVKGLGEYSTTVCIISGEEE